MNLIVLILIISFFLIAVLYRFNRAKIIGNIGEKKVSLRLHLLQDEYKFFDDVYLDINGCSVQIDHVVVSKYGVFVIETKNIKGWIFGTDKSEYWIKNMYGKKYEFRNPLKQNYYHVKMLQTLLQLPQNKFIPIVVFLKGATLKCNTSGNVVKISHLNRTIKRYYEVILDDEEVNRIIMILTEQNIKDRKYKKVHVKKVKENIYVKSQKIKSGRCPRCNGILVERKGKYGKFIACSNYPDCKFTQSI